MPANRDWTCSPPVKTGAGESEVERGGVGWSCGHPAAVVRVRGMVEHLMTDTHRWFVLTMSAEEEERGWWIWVTSGKRGP